MFQRFRNFKLSKTWIVLGVALGIGALAALAARNYLSNQMDAIEAKDRGNKVNVVVAKRELRRGEKISSENVAVRPIPIDYAHSDAVSPNDFEKLEGQTLAFTVKPGEMLLWSLLEAKKAPPFAARIGAGHRAITVPVDEISSISGLLEPGDTIDLMVTIDRKGRKATLQLLQSVRVLATGQRSADDAKTGERRQYSTVTLDATPEQAEQVIAAREAGRITALLRSPQDKQAETTLGKDLAKYFGLQGEDGKSPQTIDVQVPVLYGGRGAKVSPEGLKLGQFVRPAATAGDEAAPDGVMPAVPVLTAPPAQGATSLGAARQP